jgi:hypothetical protein
MGSGKEKREPVLYLIRPKARGDGVKYKPLLAFRGRRGEGASEGKEHLCPRSGKVRGWRVQESFGTMDKLTGHALDRDEVNRKSGRVGWYDLHRRLCQRGFLL